MADEKKKILGELRKEKALRQEILQQKIEDKAATEEITAAAQSAAAAELAIQQRRLEVMIEYHKKSGRYSAEQIKKQEELIASRQRQVESLEGMSAAQGRLNDTIDSFAAKAGANIGILGDLATSGLSVADVAHKMKAAFSDANGKLDLLKVGAAATAPVFNEVKQQLMLNARSVADMTASVASATGEGMKYNGMIGSIGSSNRQFGVGMVQAGQAVSALSGTMSTFSMQGKDTAENMAGVAARMESLGVSAGVSGAQMEYGMRIMGQTGDEAAAGVDDLAAFASGIGVAPAKMAADFQAAAPALAGYGKEAMKVFKGLAAQSKKTGLSMNELLGVTEQFDSFDTAAAAAGNLNSILGGQYLDSMQLVTAETQDQRAELLQNALLMSGQSFDAMSRLERKAVANSIGISDMSVATKLLSESSRAAAKDMKNQSISQEELAERQQAGVSFSKKMEMVMQSFAIALMPVANLLHSVSSRLISLANGGAVQVIVGLIAAFYMLIKAVQFAKAVTTAYMAVQAALAAVEEGGMIRKGLMATKNFILSGSQAAVTGTSTTMGGALTVAGKAAGSSGPGFLALAAAMLKLGFAVLMIGAGIGIAAAGLALLVMSFTSLLKVIISNISIMPTVIGTVLQLGFAFLILGASLLVSSLGFFAFGAALLFFVAVGVPAIGALLIPLFFLGLALVGVAASMYLLGIGSASAASAISPLSLGLAAIAKSSPDIGNALLVSALGFLAFGIALFQLGATGIPVLYALALPLLTFALALTATSLAMVFFGSAATIMASAVSVLVPSFGQLAGALPVIAQAVGLLIVGFFGLGLALAFFASVGVPALSAMALPLFFFGFALMGVALAMKLLGADTSTVVSGLSTMEGGLARILGMLPEMASTFGLLALTFSAMAGSMILLSYVMGTFGSTLAVLSLPLALIGLTIVGVALAIRSMATAISEMSVDNAMVTFMSTVDSVDDTKVENLESMVDQAQRYVFIQAQMNAMEIASSITEGLSSLLGLGGSSEPGSQQNQKEIVLKLNEREFARAVIESLDGEAKISLA